MSHLELYKVPESGPVELAFEFSNSFRGGWLIWTRMSEVYLGYPATPMGNLQPVWDLSKNPTIPEAHRIVMMSTFDRVMVRRTELPRLITSFEQYAKDISDPGHIPEQAIALRQLENDPTCFAVCWNQTSVNSGIWWVRLDDSDESRPYDISLDSDHWFLFDELDTVHKTDKHGKGAGDNDQLDRARANNDAKENIHS